MTKLDVKQRIANRQVVLYRRVSTKGQEKSEYKNQLAKVKAVCPKFSVTGKNTTNLKEAISGLASIEKRMASRLGTALRLLKRNPVMVMIVASADRISRRADVFDRIQAQGLGHRIIDVSTGKDVDDIIATGEHKAIQARTNAQRQARLDGTKKFIKAGGIIGRQDISTSAKSANEKKTLDTINRDDTVLLIVSELTNKNRGKKPSMSEVSDVLDSREIRTGQGHFYTPTRLSQRKKKIRERWKYAEDSYSRPRRRISHLVRTIQLKIRNKRKVRCRQAWLYALSQNPLHEIIANGFLKIRFDLCWPISRQLKTMQHCEDGCRGPPKNYCFSLKIYRTATVTHLWGTIQLGNHVIVVHSSIYITIHVGCLPIVSTT